MTTLWGLSTNYVPYSDKGYHLFNKMIEGEKRIFFEEFEKNEGDDISFGSRFNDSKKIFWALQSNVAEKDFLEAPQYYLFKVLMGACKADYHYTYEKMW